MLQTAQQELRFILSYLGFNMKQFLEIIEQIQDDNPRKIGKLPKVFKVEVKDKAEAVRRLKREMIGFKGLKVEKRLHICRHIETGESENQPCSIEKL